MTSRRHLSRHELTQAEEIEARLGPPLDRPSLFGSAADRVAARAELPEIDATRDRMNVLILGGLILAELRRRHASHDGNPADYVACPRCNSYGWRPEWTVGEWARESAERSARNLAALEERDAGLLRGVKDEVLAN
jgi:hypothetical protein